MEVALSAQPARARVPTPPDEVVETFRALKGIRERDQAPAPLEIDDIQALLSDTAYHFQMLPSRVASMVLHAQLGATA